jgi:cyclic beta-1,2-glucan synthetase
LKTENEVEVLLPTPEEAGPEVDGLRLRAGELAHSLRWLPNTGSSTVLALRCKLLEERLGSVLQLLNRQRRVPMSAGRQYLHDNLRLLSGELENTGNALRSIQKIPHARTANGDVVPRTLAIAEELLAASDYQFNEATFASFLEAFQEWSVLDMQELWVLPAMVKLVLLEKVAADASRPSEEDGDSLAAHIRSLRKVCQVSWPEVIEPLIQLDRVLRRDPVGAYARMDLESRALYRTELANIAQHSDSTELEVAVAALELARGAHRETYKDVREANRASHVGYYLVGEGVNLLRQKTGFRSPLGQRIRTFLLQYPDEFYLTAIAGLTCAIMSAIVLLMTNPNSSPGLILLTMFVLLLPCSQSAVQVVNYLVTSILRPKILPKLDFSKKIPDDCVTLIAIPCLLLNENQVRKLVEELEVRFLGNHDRNLHFALLTDLPDSPFPPREEDDPLVELCSSLIRELNEKYADQQMGSFLLLHRHRTYNPREQAWMGWERKRGKILDLNNLLRRQFDSFPVKVGDVAILPRVRFVITLDSDTELPRGSAHRMIGALDHPLNQAIIDPELNIVVAGYGILQPRVVVSVQSAARSRLARIYSGQTGLDIYTQAISDVYQDLYGEGTFAGKGIYEVDVLQRVLDGRFPTNALLSHDLVEGAYARAGLLSDIQVIEDYPSHYSAYNRRKHRWLRGDWQVVEWLTSRVPDETGTRRENPISVISQWKILDNLRRSLVEPATFLLFVLGWLCLPGTPRSWTLATIAILFVPAWCRAIFELVRAALERRLATVRGALRGLLTANVNVFLSLTFLAHQMLLSVDAMIRTLVRRIVTRRRLLQWETAAEAELAAKTRSPADVYLDWALPLAVGVGLVVGSVRPEALLAALPVVLLWAGSKSASVWLNLPPRAPRNQVSQEDRVFLRGAALLTWRYFAEFSNEEHNWLIPDNAQGEPLRVAPRLSPTNLGLLLNCRQVACQFGYLTIPEFVDQTQKTLSSMAKLESYRGHLFNWYDTRTLQALAPRFVSSVDNGNLVASLWTLDRGCRELLRQPFLQASLVEGLMDHLRILRQQKALPRRSFSSIESSFRGPNWLQALLNWRDGELSEEVQALKRGEHVYWFAVQAESRVVSIKRMVHSYTPWVLPEFESLIKKEAAWKGDNVPLERLPGFIDQLASRLQSASNSESEKALAEHLLALLPEARRLSLLLIKDLRQLATQSRELAAAMDFRFLLHPQRKLLSVGFDVESRQLNDACYDLLASEARTAVFVAIAKDEIPQETWFMLGRPYTLDQGRPVLCSWTGTLFEYLMPFIWMRSFPDTLLERSREAAVRAQRAYTAKKHIPWGISESACAKKDDSGNYNYFAFGLPGLALQKGEMNAIVISPYSTFLALPVDPDEALKNLREMSARGWVGEYGFCESADFTFPARRFLRRRCELVRCWMAHHQGMSLLSIANFLSDGMVQHWFHREPRVQATELLLQEKPVTYGRPPLEKYGTAA